MNFLSVYMKAFKISLAQRMAYRLDFFISAIVMMLSDFLIPLVSLFVYQSGVGFPGWSFYDILLLQSTYAVIKGFANPFFASAIFWVTFRTVNQGSFDLILTKPRAPLFIVILYGIDVEDLGKFFGSLVLLSYSLYHINSISIIDLGRYFLLLILGIMVYISFRLIISATTFIWIDNTRIYTIFDSIISLGQYPANIYPKLLKNIITYLPITMLAFYPSSSLLNKVTDGIYTVIFVSILLFVFSLFFWNYMCRRYASAGG